jgi:arylesterase/paraoxonase
MIKKILLSVLVVIVLVCAGGALYLYRLVNHDIDEHFSGTCSVFELKGSGEDIQFDCERALAYVSLFDRRALADGDPVGPGDILRLDLSSSPVESVSALLDGPPLRPHGISLFINRAGQRYLFVINHAEDRATGQERIERYIEEQPGLFRHKETFMSPLITRANDLVAVGERRFYVAQDVDRKSGEKLTNLIYFDGRDYAVAADDIQSGGGINASLDYRTLYIAETGAKRIRAVGLDPSGGTVASTQYIDLGSSPDNIDVAADGSLWVGAHSNVAALVMHFIMGSNAPSQILRIDPGGETPQVEEIYFNAGEEISAGSVGATCGNTLLIGSITDRKILICKRNQ